ncbi:MAG TPA: amidohydrolase, partial [Terriglobales bacterium]|nr:amidohydrolase [Terriglobales bacterium]
MRKHSASNTQHSVVKGLLLTLAILLVSLSLVAQQSSTIVLKGGKILTVSHGTIENGVVVIENGRIAAVGAASTKTPAGAKVIDVTGMTVYPGLIDSETHLGLTEIQADRMTNDLVETSDEIMPHMHVYDAFHAETELIPVARVNGITNAIVAPDSQDTLPGQDIFIQLDGRDAPEMILTKDIAMPLNFTGEQRRNESFERAKYPQTRMGMAAQLRQAFLD